MIAINTYYRSKRLLIAGLAMTLNRPRRSPESNSWASAFGQERPFVEPRYCAHIAKIRAAEDSLLITTRRQG